MSHLVNIASNPFNISNEFTLHISINSVDYNVYNNFVAAFGDPPSNVILHVIVDSAIVVSASSVAFPAMTWGTSWTGTPTFTLENGGTITGHGGNGGAGGTIPLGVGGNGTVGGNSLELNGNTVTITNGSGFIFGGAGGGGGGGAAEMTGTSTQGTSCTPISASLGGGGGGGGYINGTGGAAGSATVSDSCLDTQGWVIYQPATRPGAGQNGTSAGGNYGANGGYYYHTGIEYGFYGSGGGSTSPGTVGTDGAAGSNFGPNPDWAVNPGGNWIVSYAAQGSGGAAGKAINLSGGSVTWISGNDATHLRGTVS